MYSNGKASPILIRFHRRLYFEHGVTHGDAAIAAVGASKEFSVDDSALVGQAEELHQFAGRWRVQQLFDHKTAAHYPLTAELRQSSNRTVCDPSDVWTEI